MYHFKPEDFENSIEYEMGFSKRRFLRQAAIPSIKKLNTENEKVIQERAVSIKTRKNKEIVQQLLEEYDASCAVKGGRNSHVSGEPTFESSFQLGEFMPSEQTALNVSHVSNEIESKDEINSLKSELEYLRKENAGIKIAQEKQTAEFNAIVEKYKEQSRINEHNRHLLETKLNKAKYELNNLEEKLTTIFTKGQILKLKSGIKRKSWTEKDISQSITLYAASPKLYKLLYRKKFPLPAVRTLQKWAQKVDVTNGLIKPVFKILNAATHMTEVEKVCVLSFDEMKIRKTYCYDKSKDTTLAPKSYAQVVMIRGQLN